MKYVALVFSFLFLLTACSAPATLPAPTSTIAIATPFNTVIPPSETPTPPTTETQPAPTKFDAATWSAMDATARQAEFDKLLATTADGYTKGGFSIVKDNLVKFYKDGNLTSVYNFETGTYMTPEQAGIKEFDLTDGTKWEVEAFATGQEAIDDAYYVHGARAIQREMIADPVVNTYFDNYIYKVPGYDNERAWAPIIDSTNPSKAAFGIFACSYGSGSLMTYYGSDKKFHTDYVNEDPKIFVSKVSSGGMTISKP
jgi:hypothetical protein